jgi:glutathione S-transferase
MKLIIGNKNYSSWSLRPWLLMAAHDLLFEEVRIPLDQPDTAARIVEHSKAGKVPVLKDGDLTVWDSLAICEYISEKYLDGRGWPLILLRAPRREPAARKCIRACRPFAAKCR